MTELAWGRRYLMCPPTYFGVAYEINPWMHQEVVVDRDRAQAQWDNLVALLRAAGATVEILEPVEGLPDLVFTANAGIVNGQQFVPANFFHPQRQGETPFDVAWFQGHGWRVDPLPESVRHEGAGDALPFGDVLVSGYRWRSDARSHHELSQLVGRPVRSVELVDTRFYHLDITFCPLDERRAIAIPGAWDPYGAKVMRELIPEMLEGTIDDGLAFVANSVVVGRTVVMPACPPRIGRQLEAWGFEVVVADVSEFAKAGGAVRCLTLALDVV
ncbi:MAG: Amidinotransferase [Acidimicrobiia bacterium]|nr:Amidinotransferase [Acidimicrobiia bacterium]